MSRAVAATVTKDINCYANISEFQGVPKPCLREWTMPVIATGTVVKWEVADEDSKDARVKYESCSEPISVYVAGGGDESVASAIISAYILRADADKSALLEAASKGLLQVIVINRSPVTPPPLP
jgi:hypothetical protein